MKKSTNSAYDCRMSTVYVKVGDKIYEKIEEAIRASFIDACIVWIEQVENKQLELDHVKYAAQFDNPNLRRFLFHGTSEQVARKIIWEGFDPSFNKTSAHGKGVYFATDASYSRSYSVSHMQKKAELAYMLVCDVVLGKVGQGEQSKPIPAVYDSVTDSLVKPSMYIVNKKAAAMPRYLVAFYPK